MKADSSGIRRWGVVLAVMVVALQGCSRMPPIRTEASLDIDRFMGDWYVIAHIPTWFEKEAYNALESYTLAADGSVETVFQFNRGGPDGPLKRYHSRAFIRNDASKAVWGMQFIWPFKADYRVMYVSSDYSHTLIGRLKRDYAWIMSRTPALDDEDYARLVALLTDQGYDVTRIRRIPHG